MKKILILTTLTFIFLLSGLLYSKYQLAHVYVCESTLLMAEFKAKVTLSRKKLYSVARCKCEGIHPSFRSEVKDMNCDPPKNNVYLCTCSGKENY